LCSVLNIERAFRPVSDESPEKALATIVSHVLGATSFISNKLFISFYAFGDQALGEGSHRRRIRAI